MDANDYTRFWKRLFVRAKAAGVLTHVNRLPNKTFWIAAATGKRGVNYVYTISTQKKWIKAELLIEGFEKSYHKEVFDLLHAHKEEIEALYGGSLEWNRGDNIKRSTVCDRVFEVNIHDETTWDEAQNTMVDMMRRLSTAMSRFIQEIPS